MDDSCWSPTTRRHRRSTPRGGIARRAGHDGRPTAPGARTQTLLFQPGTAAAMVADGADARSADASPSARPSTPWAPRHRGDAGRAAACLGLHLRGRVLAWTRRWRPGATEVRFTKPVVNYVDNFLGFPIGRRVPAGSYDRERGRVGRRATAASSRSSRRRRSTLTATAAPTTRASTRGARSARRPLQAGTRAVARRDRALHAVGPQLAVRAARRRRPPGPAASPGRLATARTRRPDCLGDGSIILLREPAPRRGAAGRRHAQPAHLLARPRARPRRAAARCASR